MNRLHQALPTKAIVLFIAVFLTATIAPQLISVSPAAADDGGYAYSDAVTLDQSTYDWGYANPCPSKDTGCDSLSNFSGYGQADPWVYFLRNCTSYVAWKVHEVFNANINGWGNATDWDTNATGTGHPYTNDSSPTIGDIAQYDGTLGNPAGHVSYVWNVSGSTADLDDYNFSGTGSFSSSNTTASTSEGTPSNYIHIANMPTRMMLINGSAEAFSNDALSTSWTTQINNNAITQVAVGQNGVMEALDNSGTIWAKNNINDTWTNVWASNAAKAIAAGGTASNESYGRLMLLDANNDVWASDAIGGGWTEVWASNAAKAIAVGGGGRMMIIDANNDVWAKNGLTDAWSELWTSNAASAVAVGGNPSGYSYGRMMIIDGNGNIWAKNDLSDTWIQETTGDNVAAIAGGGSGRQFLIATNGDSYYEDTLSSTAWSLEMHNTTAIAVGNNGRLMTIDSSGEAWGKDHPTDGWTSLSSTSGATYIAINGE